jgi:hypothetical protein
MQSYSLKTYARLKKQINNTAHIDSLEIHEKNSRKRIISFFKTGNKGGKIESSQLSSNGMTSDEFLSFIIPIYLFANAQFTSYIDYGEESASSIVKQIESLSDKSEFYPIKAELLNLRR